ncbi:hypothetical protein [Streptomyces sp. NPDC047108]|uniref:hypothetical protein n=1 Tax=Streptomyces sp. NPDC047108 TaxID=3155025 RepID=UPI0033DDA750
MAESAPTAALTAPYLAPAGVRPVRRRVTAAALLASALALTACTAQAEPGPARPTTTSTAAPTGAQSLAERYRASGGDAQVYAIGKERGPEGAPQIVVRTHEADSGGEAFQELKTSVVAFLSDRKGFALDRGYLLDVFGPDGSLLHRFDARP